MSEISAKKLLAPENEELLMWAWSVQESLDKLDHDEKWIEEASRGWSDDSFYKFLYEYGLLRFDGKVLSKSDSEIKGSRKALIDICEERFRPKIGGEDWAEEVGTRWRKAYEDFADWLFKNGGERKCLRSATLKAFWFYHPSDLTMYDSYAHKALEVKQNKPITHDNFLEEFLLFHKGSQELRQEAKSYIDRQYPYEYRITDKYLWLVGCDEGGRNEILENFRAGIRAKNEVLSCP